MRDSRCSWGDVLNSSSREVHLSFFEEVDPRFGHLSEEEKKKNWGGGIICTEYEATHPDHATAPDSC